jgi:hypothetical protein
VAAVSRRSRPLPCLVFGSAEGAAASIGVGRFFFYEYVLPGLRVVHLGRKTIIPLKEVERWFDENAVDPLG